MSLKFHIAMDCTDPARMAEFWAQALDYQLDSPPIGFTTWEEFLRAQGVPETEWNNASAISDPTGQRIYFEKVPERKIAKNRVRLTINASAEMQDIADKHKIVDSYVQKLILLGASRLWVIDRPDEYWVVMQDIEGNEFSIQ